MSQVTKLINWISNQQHDYDHSQAMLYLCAWLGWVMYTSATELAEFDFSGSNIAPWIAMVVCTRTTSSPIANQKFLAVFYSDANVPVLVAPNRKYYIEIDQAKINDPSLIQDTEWSTDYLLWLNIWEIKVGTSRPSHPNYIKLWSTDWSSVKVDERRRFVINPNTFDWSNILRDIVVHWSMDIESITTGDLIATWTVELPSGTTFWWTTVEDYVNSFITDNLLTEFGCTDLEFRTWKTDAKFPTMNLLSKYLFPRPIAWTTYTIATCPDRSSISSTNTKICDIDIATWWRYTLIFTSTSWLWWVVWTNVVLKINWTTDVSSTLSLSPSTNGSHTMNMTTACADWDNIQLRVTTNTWIQSFTWITLKCAIEQNLDWILDYIKWTVI